MPSYTLEIQAFGYYGNDMPVMEIWSEGSLDSFYSISSFGTTISLTLTYGGSLPASLEFRFDDLSSESNRQIEIRSVLINDRHVNDGNILAVSLLSKSDNTTVDTSMGSFLFDSSEPDSSIFTPVTLTLTSGNDSLRRFDGGDYILDGLDGRDVIYLGSGADKVNGNDGKDIIRSGGGNDLLYGEDDDDRLYGQGGDDLIYGGNGDDFAFGNDGDDEIHGGAGNDRLVGHDGDDVITGGDGHDKIGGYNGADYLFGDAGDDQIIAGAGDDTVDGGAGNDIIYGGAGDDIINGGDGEDVIVGGEGKERLYGDDQNDIIYSGSTEMLSSLISYVLSNNVGVSFNSQTNSFYQYIGVGGTWSNADTAASAATLVGLSGVNGHLVTITSQTENAYILSLTGANRIWLSASDAATEGEWIWTSGPEAGQKFWTGGVLGSIHNSLYSNWQVNDPSAFNSLWDYAEQLSTGLWWSNSPLPITPGYVIEWEATSLLDDVDKTILNGGLGADTLYGSEGVDVFVIDNLEAIDTIYQFNPLERDYIDIRNILSYDSLLDDLTDFVQLTEAAGDTTISVDSDGSDNGSSFIDVAVLEGVTGLDINVLISGDNLLVS